MCRVFCILGIVTLVLLPACAPPSPPPQSKFTKVGEFFGSHVRLDVCYDPSQEEQLDRAVDEIWARFADIHKRMSIYDPGSDINKVNSAYDQAVRIGADTHQLIKDAVDYHRISSGVFDISVGPLVKLWKDSAKKNRMPADREIRAARARLGVEYIDVLPQNLIRLRKPGLKINIDSIGDGYAADEAARILRKSGFKDFLVDASGEVYAGGRNCRGKPWRIGVRDPLSADTSQLVDVVEAVNLAVSTSGSYEKFYEIKGVRFSHIINPVNGYPANGVLSATVIGPEARFADFWSTALCVLEPKMGARMTDALPGGYAGMVIVDKGEGRTETVTSRNYHQMKNASGQKMKEE